MGLGFGNNNDNVWVSAVAMVTGIEEKLQKGDAVGDGSDQSWNDQYDSPTKSGFLLFGSVSLICSGYRDHGTPSAATHATHFSSAF